MPSTCNTPPAQATDDMIAGVLIEPLRVIPTPGGPVMHMLRSDAPHFMGLGELYFSEVLPGCVKAWKRHTRQTQHFAVPVGQLRVVLYDDREDSPTRGRVQQVELGRPDHYALLRIPVNVWYGFTCLGESPAVIANCADIPHDPLEGERLPVQTDTIPYTW